MKHLDKNITQEIIQVAEVLNYAKRKGQDNYEALAKYFNISRDEAKRKYYELIYFFDSGKIKVTSMRGEVHNDN